jgi:DNA-binding transcriptional MerR regulator
MQSTYTIGELAREFSISLRTLRFYEDKGLIRPQRQGVNRIYGHRERHRLRLILLGKQVGFSLDQIAEMLEFYDLKDGRSSQLRLVLSRFHQHLEVLRRQRTAIDTAIDELARTIIVIEDMLRARAEHDTAAVEGVLEAAE